MRMCAVCGKGAIMAGKRNLLRGKYNPTKQSRSYPNLQWAKLPSVNSSSDAKGQGKRVKVCVSCLKKGKHLTFKAK